MKWLQKRKIKKKVRRMDNLELAKRRFELRTRNGNEQLPEHKMYYVDAPNLSEKERCELEIVERESESRGRIRSRKFFDRSGISFFDACMQVGYKHGMAELDPRDGQLHLTDSKGRFLKDKPVDPEIEKALGIK